jgi:lantibiotic modifying enzyme
MNIDKEKKELIEKILREIAEDIIERYKKNELENNIGLLAGRSGVALYMFYNGQYFNDERYLKYGQKIFEDVFKDINDGSIMTTFCSGLAGVGWMLNHLAEKEFIEKENLETLDHFDNYLYNQMVLYLNNENYDFLHGASGIAYYFTFRTSLNKKTIGFLEYFVSRLRSYVIEDTDKRTMKMISTVNDKQENLIKVYNLSLSHGMSSILVILCKIAEIVEDKSICKLLIEGLSNFIKSCELPMDPNLHSIFPNYIEVEGNKIGSYGRLAWCYGDLCVGFGLLHAGNFLKNDLLRSKAEEIFIKLTDRKDIEKQLVKDTGICHGTSGITVMCRDLFNYYKNPVYNDLSDYWLDTTLRFYKMKKSIEGFSAMFIDDFKLETGLLTGTAGVGLMFISYLTLNDDYFKEMLLLL